MVVLIAGAWGGAVKERARNPLHLPAEKNGLQSASQELEDKRARWSEGESREEPLRCLCIPSGPSTSPPPPALAALPREAYQVGPLRQASPPPGSVFPHRRWKKPGLFAEAALPGRSPSPSFPFSEVTA